MIPSGSTERMTSDAHIAEAGLVPASASWPIHLEKV